MRVETDSNGAKIFIRQSWLNDALMCQERARLTELFPESRRENDSALMGTAVHAGIEQVLNGEIFASDIGEYCVQWFRNKEKELKAEGKEVNITNTDPKNWGKHINSMALAWVSDIMPHVPDGGQTEAKFCVEVAQVDNSLFESILHPSGSYKLFFEGTADYVHSTGIWDWKTAARKYYEAEKQSQNIQSAVYATAFTKLGVVDYAVNFNFGVMIRNASSTGQIVNVTRTERHADWIINQTVGLVNSVLLARRYLPNQRQVMNDQHHLCSERWCPVWSKCKGSILSNTTDTEVSNG
jgi:hypothetical protein